MSAAHNHGPRCCCDIPPGDMPTEDADPTYLCPACPEHGAFAIHLPPLTEIPVNWPELPSDPADLLTDEQKANLQADLTRLARLRRDTEAASSSLPISGVERPDRPVAGPYTEQETTK